jgi:hypothetical protein
MAITSKKTILFDFQMITIVYETILQHIGAFTHPHIHASLFTTLRSTVIHNLHHEMYTLFHRGDLNDLNALSLLYINTLRITVLRSRFEL